VNSLTMVKSFSGSTGLREQFAEMKSSPWVLEGLYEGQESVNGFLDPNSKSFPVPKSGTLLTNFEGAYFCSLDPSRANSSQQ
jgi:hypothetical protein